MNISAYTVCDETDYLEFLKEINWLVEIGEISPRVVREPVSYPCIMKLNLLSFGPGHSTLTYEYLRPAARSPL